MCSILKFILVCIWYGFMPFFFLLKEMYNCIIIFISFILYLLEKDLETFCVATVKYFFVCVEVGPGFCSLLRLSFVAIVI